MSKIGIGNSGIFISKIKVGQSKQIFEASYLLHARINNLNKIKLN